MCRAREAINLLLDINYYTPKRYIRDFVKQSYGSKSRANRKKKYRKLSAICQMFIFASLIQLENIARL